MKLYDCTPAPSPKRVRIFLAEKGVELPLIQVDLRNGEQFGEAFRRINPDCTVPVLELDDGTTLSEIVAICQYLEHRFPDPPLLGRDPLEQARVTMWNAKVEQQGLAALAETFRNRATRMENRALPGPLGLAQIPELVERGRKRALAFFERLDSHLETSEFVAGPEFSLADITAHVMVEFAQWSKIEIAPEQANLERWHEAVSVRPSMQA